VKTASIVAALVLAGCSTSDPDPDPEPDADPVDPDVSGAVQQRFRVTAVHVPRAQWEALAYIFDLDSDLPGGDPDEEPNRLGELVGLLVGGESGRFDVDGTSAVRLGTDVAWILTTHDAGTAGFGVSLDAGVVVDGVAEPSTMYAPAVGFSDDEILAGGAAVLPLGMLTDPLQLTLHPDFVESARTRVLVGERDAAAIRIQLGLAIPWSEVDRVLAPNLAAFFTAQRADGVISYAGAVDTDGDDVITADEVRANAQLQYLLEPDLDVAGTPALSFGFELWAAAR
jgi:hypothetical protein